METAPSGFGALGISAEAEEIYRYFLRHPGTGLDRAAKALDLDPEAVDAAVETLRELALLDASDRNHTVAAEPRAGIERLIETRLNQLNAEIRAVLTARESIASLTEDHRQGTASAPPCGIERIEDPDLVRQRMDDLSFFAYRETLSLRPLRSTASAAAEANRLLDLRSLRRGLLVRAVYHPGALDDPATTGHIRDAVRLGAEVRLTTSILDPMMIFDRDVAVVPVEPGQLGKGALLVREPGLVAQLVSYFHTVWRTCVELGELADSAAAPSPPSPLERRVLAALATAEKDEVAARQVDMSLRTYRRHVAALMSRLGAVNRFQAALRAKEMNWI